MMEVKNFTRKVGDFNTPLATTRYNKETETCEPTKPNRNLWNMPLNKSGIRSIQVCIRHFPE